MDKPGPSSESKTYRVRGIPPVNCDRKRAEQLLREALGPECEAHVHSLASEPPGVPGDPLVATVTFARTPALLKTEGTSWTLPGSESAVSIDRHFLGITPLNPVDHAKHTTVYVVAIMGLSGHAFGSWKHRQGTFMWLRDHLPSCIPGAQVLLYGYDSTLVWSQSFQKIDDIARRFCEEIREMQSLRETPRWVKSPIIFVAHSLGGIVLKEAIVQMSLGNERVKQNLASIFGILFFGVPHRGMDIEPFLRMAGDQPNRQLVEALAPGSAYLEQLDAQFRSAFRFPDSNIVSFYETRFTRVAKESAPGQWTPDGPFVKLVEKDSAVNCHDLERGNHFPLPGKSHQDMVKFYNAQDDDYKPVLTHLKEFMEDAFAVVQSRFLNTFSPQQFKDYIGILNAEGIDQELVTRLENIWQRMRPDTERSAIATPVLEDVQRRMNFNQRRPQTGKVSSIRSLGKFHLLPKDKRPPAASGGYLVGDTREPESCIFDDYFGVFAPEEQSSWESWCSLLKNKQGNVLCIVSHHVGGGATVFDLVPSGIGSIPFLHQLPKAKLTSIEVTFLADHEMTVKDRSRDHPGVGRSKYEFQNFKDCAKFQSAIFGKDLRLCLGVKRIVSNEGLECESENIRVWEHYGNWSISFLASGRDRDHRGYWEIPFHVFQAPERKRPKSHHDSVTLTVNSNYCVPPPSRFHRETPNLTIKFVENNDRDRFFDWIDWYFRELLRIQPEIAHSEASPVSARPDGHALQAASTFGTLAQAQKAPRSRGSEGSQSAPRARRLSGVFSFRRRSSARSQEDTNAID